jgi:hypothetical protein
MSGCETVVLSVQAFPQRSAGEVVEKAGISELLYARYRADRFGPSPAANDSPYPRGMQGNCAPLALKITG